MEETLGPVDVISVCNAQGEIRPLRVRLERSGEGMTRAEVEEVVSIKQVPYVGVEAFLFLCILRMEGRRQLAELRYTIRTHTWRLERVTWRLERVIR